MQPLEKTYNHRFFRTRHKLKWRAEILCPPLLKVLNLSPGKSVVDLGCGTGDFVSWFATHGIKAVGVEGSIEAAPYAEEGANIIYQDLRTPLIVPGRFDLCMSIEVAEHIEPQFAANFVANCMAMSDTLLLTIAGPGQGGHGHVNLQSQTYWEDLFGFHNYHRDSVIETKLKCELHYNHRWVRTIKNNLMIFKKD